MAKATGGWIKLSPELKATNVAQLVPRLSHIQGFTDACKYGAGRVWITTDLPMSTTSPSKDL